jgi:hypothetical protein
MSIGYPSDRKSASLRNGTVTAYANGAATVSIDTASIANVPVYGPAPAVGARVLLIEQDGTLLVLGNAQSLQAEVAELRGVVDDFIALMQGWMRGEG